MCEAGVSLCETVGSHAASTVAKTQPRFHEEAPVNATTIQRGALGGVRILDMATVLAGPAGATLCADHGADVVACTSASEAVEAAERVNPDVFISDIGMSGVDGYELIRRVRMLGGHLARVPAIALTAFSRLEDRTQALLAGYQIHLTKPVDAAELLITVASLVGRISAK